MSRSRVTITGGNPFRIAVPLMKAHFRAAPRRAAYRIANQLAGKVRSLILEQSQPWAPLSPRYAAHKERWDLDPRTLIATGRYVNNIRARLSDDGQSYEVGASRDSHDAVPGRPDVTFEQLALWHEFGTRNSDGSVRMPARPHFRPALLHLHLNLGQVRAKFRAEVWDDLAPLFQKEARKRPRQETRLLR